MSLSAARRKYRQFTKKSPEAVERIPMRWPGEVGYVGRAVRSEYISDKWQPDGDVVHYFHDHDTEVHVFAPMRSGLRPMPIRGPWPTEAWMLGFALAIEIEGMPRQTWPWLDRLPVARVGWAEAVGHDLPIWFGTSSGHVLGILHPTDGLLYIVTGPGLRVTEYGIEG